MNKAIKLFLILAFSFITTSLVLQPTYAAESKNTSKAAKLTAQKSEPKFELTTAAGIEKYLNDKYNVKSPLKTSLLNIPFSFEVIINKSKYEQYDILINFNYDVKKVDEMIFENKNSIDTLDNKKAVNTQSQIKKFVETFGKDISSKLPAKKIKGQTDGSYYTYPNLKVDYNIYLRNVWVTYDFIDPTSMFADYYGNLAMYNETKVSQFKWAPEQK